MEVEPHASLLGTHVSGGQLWQGDAEAAVSYQIGASGQFNAVALMAKEYQPDSLWPGSVRVYKLPLDDIDRMSPAEYATTKYGAQSLAKRIAQRIRRGHRVLSTCWMGLNRSGLVSAYTLMELGMKPWQAIETIRTFRSPRALGNSLFVSMIEEN